MMPLGAAARNCVVLLALGFIMLEGRGAALAGDEDNVGTCNKQRQVLTGTWGIITDGDKNYPMDSHCEWLIRANSSSQFILLRFLEMDTECSYDHVFVYDGDSYDSKLLGSFSGSTLPTPVLARSGSMLILLYSDTNYVLKGFRAEYQVTDCPLNCSGRGHCQDHRCICNVMRTGEACDVDLCPGDCGQHYGQGQCHHVRCHCSPGFSGQACSLPTSNEFVGNTWHVVASGMSPRAGHAAVYFPPTDRLYVFGGYAFGTVLGDLLAYDFNESQWVDLSGGGPTPRWGHAMTSYGNYLVVYGGQLGDGSLSGDLWLYNVAKHEWHLEAQRSAVRPPPLAKHTLTQVDKQWLYLFGGTLQDGAFSSAMYRINLQQGAEWEHVAALGGKQLERRLAGHTAVFHPAMRSLLVYAGLSVDYARFSKLSDQLHAFHVDKRYWTQLRFPRSDRRDASRTPLERAFHSAAIVGDYMVVYGGYMHKHSEEEVCYDNAIYLYHLRCHKWVSFQKLREGISGSSSPVRQGVFSHTMAVRHGHTLLIAGGYSGTLRGDLLAFVFPRAITHPEEGSPFPCKRHRRRENCLANPSCGWCVRSNHEHCLEISRSHECEKYFYPAPCPGLCPALPNCQSCLIWGEGTVTNAIMALNQGWSSSQQHMCGWCVQGVQCHAIGEAPDRCWLPRNGSRSERKGSGWWGSHGEDITTLEKCQTQNFRPGLTLLKYRHPPNWDQPDEVSFINQTTENVMFIHELSGEREGNGENVVRFRGFIYPFSALLASENWIRVFMGSKGVQAVLRISTDDKEENLEVVANRSMSMHYNRTEALRPSNETLFPQVSPGKKYLLDFVGTQQGKSPTNAYHDQSLMQLVWNAYPFQNEVPDVRYLEPYRNGSCHRHVNCLSCLSDQACGWCQTTSRCVPRLNGGDPFDQCGRQGEVHFLVMWPEGCNVCSDYIYCEDCAKIPYCEWLVEEAHCVRRGRFEDAVRHPDLCPMPCHLRPNCTSCLGDPGRCAWCEQTRTCFLFSTYTTSFVYGGCREWVDEDHQTPSGLRVPGAQCRDCSRHTDCRSCLEDLLCGWCGNRYNPFVGVCTDGDFSGPYAGTCDALLPESQRFNLSLGGEEKAMWSYGSCPDVEDCLLGLHNCHANATCINTLQSYNCSCNKGFKGDGLNICEQTCSEECIHGYCSEAPDFQCVCELGWTGADCSLNCGCNNHSTCARGVGQCDRCEDLTEGELCEQCRGGSYGNATTSFGCQKCNCNGHGNTSAGLCDRITGTCFCKDNTEGVNCERCTAGYYGNPRSGGQCFHECHPRGIVTDVQSGGLGSPVGAMPPAHCLWMLTVHDRLDKDTIGYTNCGSGTCAGIMLTIHADLKMPCPTNHVYVYDGLPDYVAPGHLRRSLGAFCGQNLSNPVTVVATSGFLTVFFDRSDPSHGFNATYRRLECPQACNVSRRVCVDGKCVCKKGYAGHDCDVPVCPNNCSSGDGQGTCDQVSGRCLCMPLFGGEDCSQRVKSTQLVWTTLFDADAASLSLSSLSASLPRMGHSLLASEGDLWVFGGYSTVRGDLNDILVFNLATSRWDEVVPVGQDAPEGRHLHGAAIAFSDIYVYGGLRGNDVLDDFWVFRSGRRTWTKLDTSLDIPPLAGHTLTAVDNMRLVLIGGFSSQYGFLEKTFEYSLKSHRWRILNTTGASPIGIYGHTTVHYPPTSALYVYGGYLYKVDHAVVSGELYAFHYTSLQWFRLPPDEHINTLPTWPMPRYFHAAVTTDDYMLIIGGRSNRSGEIVRRVSAYTYKCNRWLNLEGEDIRIMGTPPDEASGLAAAVLEGHTYIFGGFDGRTTGRLTRLTLPRDLCHLFSHSRLGCLKHMGCSFCSVYEKGINRTYCYSQDGTVPPSCYNPKGGLLEVARGTACTAELIEKRNCYQYKSCVDCVTAWPAHLQAKQVCQWCSNCQQGRCIPAGASCETETECSLPQRVVTMPSLCPLRLCLASDCDKCRNLGICMWTRQVLRSHEWGHTLNIKPIFDWACVRKIIQDASFPVESMPPLACPARCHQHHNCTSCLESNGGEGGWHKCYWSDTLKECVPPSYEPLVCEGGACGMVFHRSPSQCPLPCWMLSQASHCLKMPHCGWCSFQGSRVDGRGLCMQGGIEGPKVGSCSREHILFGSKMPANVTQWLTISDGEPVWAYLRRPPENECLNGHHTCDERHEECVDTPTGFKCKCKQGYVLEGKECKPVCNQGCVFGTCLEPDVCQCHFGYVGRNCSTQCDCNGHSNCVGPHRLSDCLECQNNTQGGQCQKCKPFFVGNPVNGGRCVPCRVYCNGHSDICLSPEFLNSSLALAALASEQVVMSNLAELMKEGPTGDAICLNCQNNTEGDKCDQCVPGFFKEGGTIKDGCRPCACHGHGDMCNPLNGENCNCQNNTENDRQCSNQKNTKNMIQPCWQLQCSKCKEYFLGAPTHGHQCYRHMFLDKDYCFDPNTQEECNRKPGPLLQGRTVFFAVQPRYMNVDIRIVVDVSHGGIDFYFSAKEDTFVVDVNKTSGVHLVSVDAKYGFAEGSAARQHGEPQGNRPSAETWMELVPDAFNDTSHPSSLRLRTVEAAGLTTYVTIADPHEFLVVRGLENRLVITIPQEVHDLRTTRFYMVLRGVGSDGSDVTYGSLFFRQDQSRIDLFVFFSVFFSCFFLFLAVCVVAWKIKQAFDVRRARRLHAAEMKHMASRPFAVVQAIIDADADEFDFDPSAVTVTLASPANYRKAKGAKAVGKGGVARDSPKMPAGDDRFTVRPVAIEPTSDGIAAVATVLVQLPGGCCAPVRMSLGSALITVRGTLQHGNGGGFRVAMRRRASHVTL